MTSAISNNSIIAALFGSGMRRATQGVDVLPPRSGEVTRARSDSAELLEPADRAEFSVAGLYAAREADKSAESEASGSSTNKAAREQGLSKPQSNSVDPSLHNRESATAGPSRAIADSTLTPEEEARVRELRQRDAEVRRHEAAHKAGAGSVASGAPSFEYTTGPDGKRYAVGGEVSIDTSPVSGNPQATIAKMQQIRRAALAPAQPSAQDRAIAAQSAAAEQQARAELAEERRGESDDAIATVAATSQSRATSGIMRSQPNSGGVEQMDRNAHDSARAADPFDASRQPGRIFDLLA